MKKQILCLSTSNYYPTPTRKQNIMNRLTDCQVVYVNPPVTWIAPLKDPKAKDAISAYRSGGTVSGEHPHVTYYAQPPVLPFYNKRRGLNKINQKRLAKYLAKILQENAFDADSFLLWCYSPMSCDVVAPLAMQLGIQPSDLWSRTVYDCVDRHSAYPGLIDPQVVDGMEEDLAGNAQTVFATADGLYERLSAFNPNTHLIPNGANYELFSKVQTMEKDLSAPPTFGFVGAFQECIDYDVIRAIANEFPKARVQMVGRPLPGVDMSWVKTYPNVEIHAPVPQNELPELMKNFDVCINSFADNDLSRDVSPLKFYEYLATGKPVVSTPVPLQVQCFEDQISMIRSPEELKEKCLEALDERPDSPKRAARIQSAADCSWEKRVEQMREILGF